MAPLISLKSSVAEDGSTQTEPPAGVVVEFDIADGVPSLQPGRAGIEVLVLVRIFGEAIGAITVDLPVDGLEPTAIAHSVARELESELKQRFTECGLDWDGTVPVDGLKPAHTPGFLVSRERVLREGPFITAAICTRNRPASLAKTLESLSTQDYQRMRVLVIDNAPSDDRTQQVVREAAAELQMEIDYVVEPRPGLSWARNRAIDEADGDVVAWVDDDERCDRWWAAEIARGYVEVPEADGVSGLIVPGELVTRSQVMFENYSGVRRGRGFARAVFSPGTASQQSPLYPLPPFGAGGNMSFRREALKLIGGFNCALGAGTLTQGGEDTAALSALLLAGGTIVYQPTAIVYHYHRREYAALRRQLQGYGRGLTAFYLALVLRRPGCLPALIRLGRKSIKDEFARSGQRIGEIGSDFPRDLLKAHSLGMLQGPFAYIVAAFKARRLRRTVPRQ